ncbi:MAG: CBS domain-containing protein [Rubrivivax sp.]
MNLGTLCKRHVVSIDRGQSLHQAARLMREQHVGSIVVTDDSAEGRRVIGIVTDRDLAIEVLADSGTALAQPVGELLDGTLVSAPSHAGLEQGIALMRAAAERRLLVARLAPSGSLVRRLLVRDDQGHLAGIVSFDDLLDACAQQLSGLADVMRKGLQREATERAMASTPQTLTLQIPALGTAAWQVSAAA